MACDCLLVGKGIAGTLLALELQSRGISCIAIDNASPTSSSRIAAGLINPITGKRFVKSWRLDELLPLALQTYRSLEVTYQCRMLYPMPILRIFDDQQQENDLILRSSDPLYAPYLESGPIAGRQHWKATHSTWYIRNAWRVDFNALLDITEHAMRQQGRLLNIDFEYDRLTIQDKGFQYDHIKTAAIVFCEGHRATANPWFSYLPFEPSKGEALILSIPHWDQEAAIKKQISLIPLGNGSWWAGASNEWNAGDDLPSLPMRNWLISKVEDILIAPYVIQSHLAAIRPTVRDRRPFLGRHPQHRHMYILNGLGTKGALLAPWCAQQLAGLILDDRPVNPETDIRRWG